MLILIDDSDGEFGGAWSGRTSCEADDRDTMIRLFFDQADGVLVPAIEGRQLGDFR